nr:immunoglobulin light chain junction region [Macaca mulatta]MOY05474.1 immunoglobulin light chain junction region [Macaca mulatta]MOY05601.1 immunoglobulin light chain junction region [Macaca mulatta]MOY05995.1 immunoglobulin light chain junction region [Macaca mulatta]MOY07239.1 immunoglobulin light chain junction region [Macaca mulatta]
DYYCQSYDSNSMLF